MKTRLELIIQQPWKFLATGVWPRGTRRAWGITWNPWHWMFGLELHPMHRGGGVQLGPIGILCERMEPVDDTAPTLAEPERRAAWESGWGVGYAEGVRDGESAA